MTLSQIKNPFDQLRELLGDTPPGKKPIDMTIGAPRHQMPDFVADVIKSREQDFQKYPPITGHPDFQQALEQWHWRRYPVLTNSLTAKQHILPLNGSREGLFSALFIAKERKVFKEQPVVLIPNPFYQCYAAATIAGGCKPVYLPCYEEVNYMPRLEEIDTKLLKRTVALYLCSPSNPQGSVASKDYLKQAIALARQYDFMLFSDECYSEIYSDIPPAGALEVALDMGCEKGEDPFSHVITFNSLSKRSNVPGLRSGFCAGDAKFMTQFTAFRNVACPLVPLPIQFSSTNLWSDEDHVVKNRSLYQVKFDLADEVLKDCFKYKKPEGGFFLWLDFSQIGGGVKAASIFWKDFGVKILPGAFLAQNIPGEKNPGEDYGRVAMVHDLEDTRKALEYMIQLI